MTEKWPLQIFVEGQENSSFPPGEANDISVSHAWRDFLNAGHITAQQMETRERPPGDILVR